MELIAERGLDGLPEALTILIDTAMRVERERQDLAGFNVTAAELPRKPPPLRW